MIETTICIDSASLKVLNRISSKRRKSNSMVIRNLLGLLSDQAMDQMTMWKRVRYRPRSTEHNLVRMHLYLEEPEYEYILDLRKLLKLSVSFIVKKLILLYDESQKSGSNFLKSLKNLHYDIFVYKDKYGTIKIQVNWGFSPG